MNEGSNGGGASGVKKILILYATAGIGHKKAAIAVNAALSELKIEGKLKDVEVVMHDALDFTSPSFKWSYLKLYLLAVNRLSVIWGLMYYLTDNYFVNLIVRYARRVNNWFNSGRLRKYLIENKFDVVISTHFFASEVIADMKRAGTIDTKLITVVTDYRLHSWWVAPGNDLYVVAGDDAHQDLVKIWKVDDKLIRIMGIPAEPVFSRALNKDDVCKKLGIKKDKFTVLVLSGGFGVGPVESVVRGMSGVDGMQAIVICGHNEDLAKRINSMKGEFGFDVTALGFVNNVHEYMSCADLLVSKSGGISVTEALNRELPIVVISPIPGQETRNAEFIISHGAAVMMKRPEDLKAVIGGIISDRGKLESMRNAIKKIRKPDACYDIAKLAVEMAEKVA